MWLLISEKDACRVRATAQDTLDYVKPVARVDFRCEFLSDDLQERPFSSQQQQQLVGSAEEEEEWLALGRVCGQVQHGETDQCHNLG